MNKGPKIFDIRPPQNSKEKVEPLKRPQKESDPEQPTLDGRIKEGSARMTPKKLFLAILLLIVAFILVSQFVLNKTEIRVYPVKENAALSGKITANIAKTGEDLASKTILGKILEEEKIFSQEFTSSGTTTEGKKAEGEITIYNNYSDAPQALVANTRFISSGGKIFRTVARVTVPGGTYVKGKLQPGSIRVKVVADQPGVAYNIGQETFSILGFAGTPKYTAFYGKSSSAMTGGFLGIVPEVTKGDLDGAKKLLTDRAKTEAEDSLKKTVSGDFVFSEDAVSSEIVSSTSSVALGATVEKFTYNVEIKTKMFVFSKTDLDDLFQKWFLSTVDPVKSIQEGSLQLSWEINSVDFKGGKMTLDCDSSATVYSDIKGDELKKDLAGRSFAEAQQILSALPQVDSAQIKSWPFWMNKIPQDTQKIKIKLVLD